MVQLLNLWNHSNPPLGFAQPFTVDGQVKTLDHEIIEYDSLNDVLDDLEKRGITGFMRYKAVNRYVALKARYNDTPVSGSFELTPLCNFDCKMCYVHLKPEQLKPDESLLTINEWKTIIRQAVDAGMMYATLTGGECLTYPGFKEIYLYLVSLGIQPDVLTNGRLLTKEMIDFFVKYPPGSIQVTIYGSCEEAYEAVTGHRAFQQVIDGITRVKEAELNLFLTVSPSIYMKNDVKALLDFIHSLNVPYAIGEATLKARDETGRDINEYAVDLHTLMEINAIEQDFYRSASSTTAISRFPRYLPKKKRKLVGLLCGGAHSTFHVNWRGDVCPCIGFAETVRVNAFENGFAEALKQVQERMRSYMPPEECQKCTLEEHCAVCPAEKTYGSIHGQLNTNVCQRIKRKNPQVREIEC